MRCVACGVVVVAGAAGGAKLLRRAGRPDRTLHTSPVVLVGLRYTYSIDFTHRTAVEN